MKIAPATILSGPFTTTATACYALIQKALCKKNSCKACIDCMMIQEQRHHHLVWINPEKKYTLDALEPIFLTIEFTLQPDEQFFFILSQADLLTQACANSLLKIVEEPPAGYHFIFLTTQAQNITATIRSRSQIIYTDQTYQPALDPFLRHFTASPSLPTTFLKELQTQTLEDHAIPEALDQLLSYWIDFYSAALLHNGQEAGTARVMIELIQKSLHHPPMPGSGKIFWRNLYLAKDAHKKELASHGTS